MERMLGRAKEGWMEGEKDNFLKGVTDRRKDGWMKKGRKGQADRLRNGRLDGQM
jgi:hypothetical protein